MRNYLAVILLFFGLSVSGATYYVDPSGSDSNNGSSGSPWKTLAYACSKVKTSGDIIHLNSGTFIETAQSLLAIGVSIEGEGVSSVIQSRVGGTSFTILLSSSAEATNGNQHISNLKMDGNKLTGYGAIKVAYRKNVEIFNCTFIDFNGFGVSFINGEPPTTFATGNSFHDNIVTNCSGYSNGARGDLEIQGQDGMLIYNNNMTVNRGTNDGDVIYGVEGFIKNVKIYNNTLSKTYIPGTSSWDFAIEIWNWLGGNEIYNNIITGSIDVVLASKGSSAYSVWIHDNIIGQPALKGAQSVRGVLFEYQCADAIVERNLIQNVAQGIYLQQGGAVRKVENISINNNIFNNIGANVSNTGWGIYWSIEEHTDIANNISICNNVISAQTGSYSTMYGIGLPDVGTGTNVTIRNNIIVNFDNSAIFASGTGSTTIKTLSLENNIFYGNGNSNTPRYVNGMVPSGNTTQNNIVGNPLFVSGSDFHLQAGSPAIGKGIAVSGVTTDYDGNAFFDPPSIGAYEYGSSVTSPDVPSYQSSVIADATPSLLAITYSTSLAGINPSASAFSVMVNSTARTVNSVAVSGSKVNLTLATAVVAGDVVTLSYTKPSSNPLQTSSGGQAITISSKSVTNNVSSADPVYVSSAIENATPSSLDMTYNTSLASILPATSAFSVMVNSNARTVSKVAVSGTRVQLTLASPVVIGDVVTVAYTIPASNPLQTTTGGQAATISAQTVTNKVSSVNPVYVSSSIENATPTLLTISFSLTLANIVPSTSAFTVVVNSKARTVSKAAISGGKVQLTLASPVVYGDVVTAAYKKPSRNPLQTTGGSQSATFTSKAVTNNVIALSLVYASSSIEDATPSLLDITYSLSLANIVPAASAFAVLVNSTARAVNTVAVSGTRAQLTLASPVVYGDVVTVAYTKPASNPLQTSTGAQTASMSAKAVTNKVALVIPVYVSSVVENATPSLLEMTYNLTLANKIPSSSAFTVLVNSNARAVSQVVVSGTKVQLTLASPVVNGDFITVAYRKPSSNPLQTLSGGQAATLTAQNVTNKINPSSPEYVSSVIKNATPSLLEMTYSLSLANIIPAASAFAVLVNSNAVSVNAVTVSGTIVQLTLGSSILAGDIVTVSYTVPSASPLQSVAGGIAASIVNQQVNNNIANISPDITITSPAYNSSYTTGANITITASATDADGSITTVEFYDNNILIGSTADAPYTIDWNNVEAGIYSLTAIATDDRNGKTVSSAIAISVADPIDTLNLPPVVLISIPAKGNQYDTPASIEIEVTATDPDGTVSKVELYNGSKKLTEMTAAPYLFTWKSVNPGNYSVKAVAYDNLNATAISSQIEFKVGGASKYDANSEIINLYPNPNNGNFSIEFMTPLEDEKCKIVITDLGGKIISDEPLLEGESLKHFDMSYIRSGVYVMSVITKGILVTKKFIKY